MFTRMQDYILRQFEQAATSHQRCASPGDSVSAVVSHNFVNSGYLYAMDSENRTLAKLIFDFQHGYCTLSVEDAGLDPLHGPRPDQPSHRYLEADHPSERSSLSDARGAARAAGRLRVAPGLPGASEHASGCDLEHVRTQPAGELLAREHARAELVFNSVVRFSLNSG
jgi:hypothetical protein